MHLRTIDSIRHPRKLPMKNMNPLLRSNAILNTTTTEGAATHILVALNVQA